MVRVFLEPEAAALIRESGGQLILYEAPFSGCCGIGSVPVPSWEIGRPRRPLDEYRLVISDGVEVYLDKQFDRSDRTVQVRLTKMLGWRSLSLFVPN